MCGKKNATCDGGKWGLSCCITSRCNRQKDNLGLVCYNNLEKDGQRRKDGKSRRTAGFVAESRQRGKAVSRNEVCTTAGASGRLGGGARAKTACGGTVDCCFEDICNKPKPKTPLSPKLLFVTLLAYSCIAYSV